MYSEVLTAAGFSTVEATNAENSLRRAATIRPAVIVIMDLRLGEDADGLEFCEKLKEHPATKDIPMIVVTDWTADKKLRKRAEAAGCAAVLLKPVSPNALLAVIQEVVQSEGSSE